MQFPLMLLFVLIVGCSTALRAEEPVDDALPCPHWDGAAPIIDGVLDDALWRGALAVPLTSASPKLSDSQALLAWDDAHLYCAIICPDRNVVSTMHGRDMPLWKQDVAELFLAPGLESVYYEIQVGPAGQVLDQLVIAPAGAASIYRAFHLSVDLAMRTAARVDAEGFTVEMAIPFSELRCAPRRPPLPGDTWGFLAIAQDVGGGGRNWVRGSQPLQTPHLVHSYRRMRFIDPVDDAWRRNSAEPGPRTPTWCLDDLRGAALSTPQGPLPYDEDRPLGYCLAGEASAWVEKVETESVLYLSPLSAHYPLSVALEIPGPQTVRLRCRLSKKGAIRVREGMAEGSAITMVADGQTILPRRRLYGVDWRLIDIPIPAKGAKVVVTVDCVSDWAGDHVEMTVDGDGQPPNPVHESVP